MIWKRAVTLQALNAMGEGNMVGLLDIQFIRIGDDEIEATMPVDHRTISRLVYCTAGHPSCSPKRWARWRGICAPKGSRRLSGLRLTLTIFARCAAGACAAFVAPCMPVAAIRCGR